MPELYPVLGGAPNGSGFCSGPLLAGGNVYQRHYLGPLRASESNAQCEPDCSKPSLDVTSLTEHVCVLPLVKDRNDLESRTVQRPIIEGVGKPMKHHAPEVAVHDRKGDGVLAEQVLSVPQGCLKRASETDLLAFIPSSSSGDIFLRFESVEDLHGLCLTVQAGVHLLRGYVLRRWIGGAAVQLPFMPFGHRNLPRVGGKAVPDVLDEPGAARREAIA